MEATFAEPEDLAYDQEGLQQASVPGSDAEQQDGPSTRSGPRTRGSQGVMGYAPHDPHGRQARLGVDWPGRGILGRLQSDCVAVLPTCQGQQEAPLCGRDHAREASLQWLPTDPPVGTQEHRGSLC